MRTTLAAALSALALAAASAQAQTTVYSDTFSTDTSANYAVDRANPGGFSVTGGELLLNVVNDEATNPDPSGFFSSQGIRTNTGDFGAGRVATLTVDLFVPAEWDTVGVTRAGDLWARIDEPTQTVGNDFYPTMGVYNIGDSRGALVSLFTASGSGAIVDLPTVPINFGQFNQLGLRFSEAGVEYLFNGNTVFTDSSPEYAAATTLDQAFLQGFEGTTADTYTARFDNLSLTVTAIPEPMVAATAGLLLGGTLLRRRRVV